MKPLLLALALGSPAFAAATDAPAEEALRFVEKLRERKIDLEPGRDTALSAATGKDKRKLIEQRIARLADEIGKGELEAGPGTVDGDMAAVLVRQASGFDPDRLKVLAIGLIRKNGRWQAAPVPGSFENTGLGYDDAISKRLAALETWMMREQVVDLNKLREKAAERLREAISKKLKPDELHETPPDQLTRRFMEACAKRDKATVLGMLGGLQSELPDDWSSRVSAVDGGFSSSARNSPWLLLTAPGVIRTITQVHSQSGDRAATVDLALLDASDGTSKASMPRIQSLELGFTRDDAGLWRIDLPESFYLGEPASDEPPPEPSDVILHDLPAAWRRDFPATRIEQAKDAVDHLVQALRGDSAVGLIPLLSLEGDPALARLGVMRLAMIWQDLHQSAQRTPMLLGFQEIGDAAVAAFQMFSPREPGRADLRTFYLVRENGGWLLASGLRPSVPPAEKLREIKAWADERAAEWSRNWEALCLSESAELKALPAGEGPTEAEARRVFEAWNAAILKGDAKAAIGLTAHLDRGRGQSRLLQNLGHELTGALKTQLPATLLGVIRKGCWTGISARIGEAGDSSATYPLYPLVNTPAGPRVLGEISLFANGDRTRDYLNTQNLERLKIGGEADASTALQEMYEIHRKSAEADRPRKTDP